MSLPAQKPANTASWQLWVTQILAILRIELKKNLMKKRNIWIYLLALAPAPVFALHVLLGSADISGMSQDTSVLAGMFQFFYLRLAIFFGCMILFTWLFRGEIVEKSLHYYFLAPVRRQVLIIGKYLAGAITASFIFCLGFFLCFGLTYLHFGRAGLAFVFSGPGLGHLFAYLGVTVLACLGYGAVFLAFSLVIRNPILPGIAVLLWETFHPVLPALLQKFSVMFYLKQLCPVSVGDDGQSVFTVIVAPVSPWLAVPGLLCLCAAILVFACFRIRRTEISYLAD